MTALALDGMPIGSLAGTRVLTAHVRAAAAAVAEALADLGPDETSISDAAAARIAAAVLTAEDGNRGPEYVIAIRTPSKRVVLLGRYRTFRAAVRATERGLPVPGRPAILPICPYPRLEKR